MRKKCSLSLSVLGAVMAQDGISPGSFIEISPLSLCEPQLKKDHLSILWLRGFREKRENPPFNHLLF